MQQQCPLVVKCKNAPHTALYMSRLVEEVIYIEPQMQTNLYIFNVPIEAKSDKFFPFGIMADIFDCYTVCLFFFLFEML